MKKFSDNHYVNKIDVNWLSSSPNIDKEKRCKNNKRKCRNNINVKLRKNTEFWYKKSKMLEGLIFKEDDINDILDMGDIDDNNTLNIYDNDINNTLDINVNNINDKDIKEVDVNNASEIKEIRIDNVLNINDKDIKEIGVENIFKRDINNTLDIKEVKVNNTLDINDNEIINALDIKEIGMENIFNKDITNTLYINNESKNIKKEDNDINNIIDKGDKENKKDLDEDNDISSIMDIFTNNNSHGIFESDSITDEENIIIEKYNHSKVEKEYKDNYEIIDLFTNNKIYYNLNIIDIEDNVIYTNKYKIIDSNDEKSSNSNIKYIISIIQDNNRYSDGNKKDYSNNERYSDNNNIMISININIIDNKIILLDDMRSVSSITSGIICKYNSILHDKVEGRENKYMLIGILLHKLYRSNNIVEEIRKIKDTGVILLNDDDDNIIDKEQCLSINDNNGKRKDYIVNDNKYRSYDYITVTDIERIYNIDIISILLSYVKNIMECKKYSNNENNQYEICINSKLLGLRGIIDILNDTEIIEIKTGKRHVEHQAQLLFYSCILFLQSREIAISDSNHSNDINISGDLKYRNNTEKIGYFDKDKNLRLLYLKDGSIFPVNNDNKELDDLIKIRNDIAFVNSIIKKDICEKRRVNINDVNINDDNAAILIPKHNCSNRECNILNRIYQFNTIKDLFLYRLWIGINLEDMGKGSTMVNVMYVKNNIIILDKEIEYKYIDLYVDDIMVDRGRIIEDINEINKDIISNIFDAYKGDEQNIFYEKPSTNISGSIIELKNDMSEYCLTNKNNIKVVNTSKNRFCKIMRYSLLNIAVDNKYITDSRIKRYFKKRNIEQSFDNSIEVLDISDDISLDSFDSEEITMETPCKEPINDIDKIPQKYHSEFKTLNFEQQCALISSLENEYSLIYGYPGTGKTKVLVLLVHILAAMKMSVLIVCFTKRNIQNIISKLHIEYYYKNDFNKKELFLNKKNLTDFNVVISTCYSFREHLYNKEFDYLIVDEATQQHLLMTLIPVSICKRFVLIGDDRQLGALSTRSDELSISLFEFFGENLEKQSHKKDESNHIYTKCINSINNTGYSNITKQKNLILTKHYRMGSLLLEISNTLFYNNTMVCMTKHTGKCIFVEYSNFDIRKYHDYTFLCFTNKQVFEINNILNIATSHSNSKKHNVSTVDRYQGSECDKVVVIFHPISKLMESVERINVAITRAKKEMILVGNREEMNEIPILSKILNIVDNLTTTTK
ncbi:DNA helicase [Spraguea lophii 42_110]|uniref:DNA helicase n=1 Tax=Spraguea lophii (strain 42_110) TaxID=1358809 RepID=S7XKL2_SPRLO|nr:DNA helicase [Spraguea lophii 42_110]